MKASLNPAILQTKKNIYIDNVDIICLQLKTHSKKIIIGRIYRPPAHNINSDMKLFHQIMEVSNSFESVIFGDFNLPVTSWGNSLKSHMGHDLYDNLLESGLSQHVNKPTRGDNILDLIFSTNDGLVSNVSTDPEFSTIDHRIVSFNIDLEVYKDNISKELIFIYRRGN